MSLSPITQVFGPLNKLTYLILDGNEFNLTEVGKETTKDIVLPCLEHLSLKGNPLTRIEKNFFVPLSCSPLKELYLQSADLLSIHPGKV